MSPAPTQPLRRFALLAATVPWWVACGEQGPAEPGEEVQVAELADVALATAFRWQDSIFVRDGRELPPGTEIWFRSPRCTTSGEFELLADWLGVTGPRKPRFDGDLRPPYRVTVRVVRGPDDYLGTTISVRADSSTEPGLGPADVKASLWEGGTVLARMACDAGRFRALSLQVPPQR